VVCLPYCRLEIAEDWKVNDPTSKGKINRQIDMLIIIAFCIKYTKEIEGYARGGTGTTGCRWKTALLVCFA